MPELAQLFIGLSPASGDNYSHLLQIIQGGDSISNGRQYFGLMGLKSVKEQQVQNAINPPFFMGNVFLILPGQAKEQGQAELLAIPASFSLSIKNLGIWRMNS